MLGKRRVTSLGASMTRRFIMLRVVSSVRCVTLLWEGGGSRLGDHMPEQAIMLKVLLRERHWQNYSTFCAEYDKAAGKLDSDLAGSYPSRAQLHRWLSGALRSLPYPDHCRLLEEMLSGWTADQLFQPAASDLMYANGQSTTAAGSQIAGPSVFAAPSIGLRPSSSRHLPASTW
jgi:hypothetical protein